MFHTKEIGDLPEKPKKEGNEKSDLVIFRRENLAELAELLDLSEKDLITKCQGVICENLELMTTHVDELQAVIHNGNTRSVVVIGLEEEEFLRFLRDDETTFSEYLQRHPLYPEIKWNEELDKNEEIFDEIVKEYKQKNLENS